MKGLLLGALLPVDSFNVVVLIAVFVVISLGLHFTFGLLNVVNLAHGEFLLIGAYTAFQVQELTGSALLGMAMAPIVAGGIGVLVERGILQFLYSRPFDTLLATFGVSVIIRQAMQLWFTANPRTVDDPIGGSFELAGFNVPWWRFTIVIAALVLIAAILFMLDRSRFGLYARATIRNPQLAATMGINISITRALLFGAGCALAGLGGALIAPINTLSPSFGVLFLVNSFLVVILGGQGSLRGLVAAAVVLGGSLAILQFMISTVFAQIAVLIIAIVGVRLRPLIVDKLATRSDRGRSVVTSSPSIDP